MTVDDRDTTRDDVVRRAEATMEDVDRRLRDLERRSEEARDEAVARLRPALSRLRANRDAVRSAVDRLRSTTGEVWEPLARDVERGYEHLATEVELVRSDLEAELAETAAAYQEAVEHQMESWQRRLDQLRVQAKLAQMESRDDVVDLLNRVEEAYHAARRDVDRARGEAPGAVESLRSGLTKAIDDLREGADTAWQKLTGSRS